MIVVGIMFTFIIISMVLESIFGCGDYQKWIFLSFNLMTSIMILVTIIETCKVVKKKVRYFEMGGKGIASMEKEVDRIVLAAPMELFYVAIINVLNYGVFVPFENEKAIYYLGYTLFSMLAQASVGRMHTNTIWEKLMPRLGHIYTNKCCDAVSSCFIKVTSKSMGLKTIEQRLDKQIQDAKATLPGSSTILETTSAVYSPKLETTNAKAPTKNQATKPHIDQNHDSDEMQESNMKAESI